MTFLPNDYELPKLSNGYTKLNQGINKLRILDSPVTGFVRWEDKKPLRTRSRMTSECRHFWALKVYNYATKKVEVYEITQSSIQESLLTLSRGSWGDPTQYDIEINKTGQDKDTRYMVTPCKPEPMSDDIRELNAKTIVNLDALLDGGNPFGDDDLSFTV